VAARVTNGATGRVRSLVQSLSVPDYRRIWCSQLASELGDWAARIALAVGVYQRTHSALESSLVLTVSVLPYAGLGQLITAAAERFSRKRLMVASDLFRAAVFLALCLPVPVWVLLLGAFVAGSATPAFEASRYAIKADISRDDALYGASLALSRLTEQLSTVTGLALGGGLVAAFGIRGALAVNAASFLASAAFLTRLSPTSSPGRTAGTEVVAAAGGGPTDGAVGATAVSGSLLTTRDRLRLGFGVLFSDPVLRWCMILGLVIAMPGVAVEALAATYGHGHPADVVLLAVAVPVGTILMVAVLPHAGPPRRLLRAAGLVPLIGGAAALAVFVLMPHVPEAAAGFLACGVAEAFPVSAGPVMGRRLPDEVRSTSFSLLVGAGFLGGAAGSAIGGWIALADGPRSACAAAGALMLVMGLGLSVWLPDPDKPLRWRKHSEPALTAAVTGPGGRSGAGTLPALPGEPAGERAGGAAGERV
jgi:MFS family permease